MQTYSCYLSMTLHHHVCTMGRCNGFAVESCKSVKFNAFPVKKVYELARGLESSQDITYDELLDFTCFQFAFKLQKDLMNWLNDG